MNETVCIIVPHGDDETLGFSAAIQKHVKENDDVYVLFCRKPHNERTKVQFESIKNAQKILQYKKFFSLDISLTDIPNDIFLVYKKIENILLDINPTIVYTTFWGDIHQDHKAVFESVTRIVRTWGKFKIKKFIVGEIPSSTEQRPYLDSNIFHPNYYIKMSQKMLDNKIKALECYYGEMREYPHPRSTRGITSKAECRGQECGSEYAEAYMILKLVE